MSVCDARAHTVIFLPVSAVTAWGGCILTSHTAVNSVGLPGHLSFKGKQKEERKCKNGECGSSSILSLDTLLSLRVPDLSGRTLELRLLNHLPLRSSREKFVKVERFFLERASLQ